MSGNDKFFAMFRDTKVKMDPQKNKINHTNPVSSQVKGRVEKQHLVSFVGIVERVMKKRKQQVFLKLIANSLLKKSNDITLKLLANTLNHRMTVNKTFALNSLKSTKIRWRNLKNFAKKLNALSASKRNQFKRLALYNLQRNCLNKMLNQSKNKRPKSQNASLDHPHLHRNSSQTSTTTPSLTLGDKIKGKQIKPRAVTERNETEDNVDIPKIKKEHEQYRLMELSEETKLALKRVQRYNPKSYPKQVQSICKDVFILEMKRLEKVKNANREMRSFFYDNELTVTVLCHLMKSITTLNEEVQELKKYKELWQKQEAKQKQKEFLLKMQEKSNKQLHRNNVQNQMRKAMDHIEELIKKNEMNKAVIQIQNFIKKYEKEDYARDATFLYKVILEVIPLNLQMEDCMKEIGKILLTLSMADLNKKSQCLRALKSNHKEFNIFKSKYRKNERFYEKQMLNIMKHMQDFNDNIIKYLQVSNELGLQRSRQKQSMDRLSVDYQKKYERKLNMTQQKYKNERKKSAQKDNQSTTLSFQKHILETDTEKFHEFQESTKVFRVKIKNIIEKIEKKQSWHKEFQAVKNDQMFKYLEPFAGFIAFEEAARRSHDQDIKKEVHNFTKLLEVIKIIFHKQNIKHQQRFQNIAKVLESSGKKDPHLYQLHRELELLMIAIIQCTKQQNVEKHLKILQNRGEKLSKENKELANQNNQYRIRVQEIAEKNRALTQSRSFCDQSLSRSRSRNITNSRSRQKANGIETSKNLNEKEVMERLETVLSKLSVIALNKKRQLGDKLSEIDKSVHLSSKKHPNYTQIFQLVCHWVQSLMTGLEKSQ